MFEEGESTRISLPLHSVLALCYLLIHLNMPNGSAHFSFPLPPPPIPHAGAELFIAICPHLMPLLLSHDRTWTCFALLALITGVLITLLHPTNITNEGFPWHCHWRVAHGREGRLYRGDRLEGVCSERWFCHYNVSKLYKRTAAMNGGVNILSLHFYRWSWFQPNLLFPAKLQNVLHITNHKTFITWSLRMKR